MHHALLVAGQVVLQAVLPLRRLDLVLQEGLAQTGHIPMAEDAEHAGEELLLLPVPLAVLVGEKADQGLAHGQSDPVLAHGCVGRVVAHCASLGVVGGVLSGRVIGSRLSTSWLCHVSRIQWWMGSSVISQVPSAAGPAITLR